MTTYRPSILSIGLGQYRHDADTAAATAHHTMREAARLAVDQRNDLIDLLMGAGHFAVLYEGGAPSDASAGVIADELCNQVRYIQSPYSPINEAFAHFVVRSTVEGHPTHPVSQNWRVVRDACSGMGGTPPDWDDVDQRIAPTGGGGGGPVEPR